MTPGCPEQFNIAFLLYILRWNRGPRRRTEQRLAGNERKVRRFRHPRELARWLTAGAPGAAD